MRECSGVHERSEQCGGSKRESGASERASGQASGAVLTSRLLCMSMTSSLRSQISIKKYCIVSILSFIDKIEKNCNSLKKIQNRNWDLKILSFLLNIRYIR